MNFGVFLMHNNNESYIKKYEPFWGSWILEEFIGQGSSGKVFKISKEEWGFKYESALKVISIPSDEQYREATSTLGKDETLLKPYFEDAVKSIIKEIVMLYNLRGNSNIVSYEDHKVEIYKDKVGWDILIRMEYLMPLNKYIHSHNITIGEIISIGMDICSALDTCSKKGIIHRDIKDDNIFVSKDKNFKLGDFSIARELIRGISASIRGTPLYIAPEVFKGEVYDSRADMYSLGLVLYKLLNSTRFPFMPPYPAKIKIKNSEDALDKRLSGTPLPPPCNGNEPLGKVVLKMCEYRPENRFDSHLVAREALKEIYCSLPDYERHEIVLPGANEDNNKTLNNVSHTVQDTVLLDNIIQADKDPIEKPVSQNNGQKDVPVKPLNKRVGIFGSLEGSETSINQTGNKTGNIINGGLASAQGIWTYLSCSGHSNNVYKIKMDESETVKLNSDESWFINVVGNWIYYSNTTDGDKIYKIAIDGTNKQKIIDDSSWYINVFEDWIYYSNESDNYKLYKVRIDGSEKTKLNDDNCLNVCVYNKWLYYSNRSDGGKLYKIRIDARDRKKICNDEASFFDIDSDWIYFCNKTDGMRLYKIHIDGIGKEKINDDICRNINVSDNWIYYCNKSDGSKIYRIRPDGSQRTRLNEDYSDFINIIGDWIYYCNKNDNSNTYKIKRDGLNKSKVSLGGNMSGNSDDDEWIYL